MENQEKIDLILELVYNLSERLNTSMSIDHSDKGQNISGDSIRELDQLIQKLGSIKISSNTVVTDQLNKKIDLLISKLKIQDTTEEIRAKSQEESKSIRTGKDLKQKIIYANVIRVLIIFTVIGLGTSLFMFNRYSLYKQSHLKYQLIYYSGNQKYLHQLDSIWNIDSLKNIRLEFIDQKKREEKLKIRNENETHPTIQRTN